ncbi:MAG: DUF484 family protein [Pseudomonadota bacterium]|nr:DUF484 family protein [Pseudomonadota bacterium]
MSRQKKGQPVIDGPSEEAVAEYLKSYPDFFERHSSLFADLTLAHETGGPATSLLERQIALLRQRNRETEEQLKDLVSVAKLNSSLVEKIHQLSLAIIAEATVAGRLKALEKSLNKDFAADRAVLVLFKSNQGMSCFQEDTFVRVLDQKDSELRPFEGFLKSKAIRCGLINSKQRIFLFGREASEADPTVTSAVMMPLGRDCKQGFLVIGSYDANHFHPGQRIDLLNRLNELVSMVLDQHPDAAQDCAS